MQVKHNIMEVQKKTPLGAEHHCSNDLLMDLEDLPEPEETFSSQDLQDIFDGYLLGNEATEPHEVFNINGDDRLSSVFPGSSRGHTSSVASSPGSNSQGNCDGLCKICGEMAARYLFYGAQSCNSCRVFFRRSVKSNTYSDFNCKTGRGDCRVKSKSWKSCKQCRFLKCLEAGMNIKYVSGQEETKLKRKHMSKELDVKNFIDAKLVADLADLTQEMVCSTLSLYLQKPEYFLHACNTYYHGQPVPLSTVRGTHQYYLDLYHKFFQGHFMAGRGICAEDQRKMQVNISTMLAMNTSMSVIELFMPTVFVPVLKRVHDSQDGECETLRDIFSRLNIKGKRKSRKKPMFDLYYSSLWSGNPETEDTFKRKHRPAEKWHQDTSWAQAYLLGSICLFSQVGLDLKQPGVVERLQFEFVDRLQRYLQGRFGAERATVLMGRAMRLLAQAQEMDSMRAELMEKAN